MGGFANFMQGFAELFTSIFKVIISFFSQILYIFRTLMWAFASILEFVSWIPEQFLILFLTFVSVCVFYKLTGREG